MSSQQNTVLTVSGMTCGSCVRHVTQALRELEGVEEVDVRLREGRVLVQHDAQRATTAAMVEALREAGYDSAPEREAP